MICLTTLTIPMPLARRAFLAPLVYGRYRQDSDIPPQGCCRSSMRRQHPQFVCHSDELRRLRTKLGTTMLGLLR